MKKLFVIVLLILLWACSPYEDESYFEPVKTDNYLLDNFSGDTDFKLDSSYDIAGGNINPINFDSFDGKTTATLHGIYIGDLASISTNTIIIYCHDKTGNIDNYWQRLKLLAQLGLDQYGILAFDYRGYGKSTGETSENSLNADLAAAISWLEPQGLSGDRLILYGFGLGTAPVVELAANPRTLSPSKIILEAPIASMELILQEALYQSIPGHFLTDLKLNNVGKIKAVNQPLLWLHGAKDKIYPIEHGQLVYAAHPGIEGTDKFKLTVSNASHRDIPPLISTIESDSYAQYKNSLLTFFQ